MSFPATYNISLYSGDTYEFVVAPKDANGNTFSLTDYTAEMKIANARGSSATFSENASVSIEPISNTIICKILPALNNQLSASVTYVYDVQISKGSNLVYTLLTGNINITEDVT